MRHNGSGGNGASALTERSSRENRHGGHPVYVQESEERDENVQAREFQNSKESIGEIVTRGRGVSDATIKKNTRRFPKRIHWPSSVDRVEGCVAAG